MWMTEHFTVIIKDKGITIEHPEGKILLSLENEKWIRGGTPCHKEDLRKDTLGAHLYGLRTTLTSLLLKKGVHSVGHIQEIIDEVHEVITIILRSKEIK